jgi:hypothetical protein
LEWQKNSKTKEENTVFFIFMSSCPEVSFLGQKREKVPTVNRVQFLLSSNGYKKSVILR